MKAIEMESKTNFAVKQNDVTVGNAEGLQRSNVGAVVCNVLQEKVEDETDYKAQGQQGNGYRQNLG